NRRCRMLCGIGLVDVSSRSPPLSLFTPSDLQLVVLIALFCPLAPFLDLLKRKVLALLPRTTSRAASGVSFLYSEQPFPATAFTLAYRANAAMSYQLDDGQYRSVVVAVPSNGQPGKAPRNR